MLEPHTLPVPSSGQCVPAMVPTRRWSTAPRCQGYVTPSSRRLQVRHTARAMHRLTGGRNRVAWTIAQLVKLAAIPRLTDASETIDLMGQVEWSLSGVQKRIRALLPALARESMLGECGGGEGVCGCVTIYKETEVWVLGSAVQQRFQSLESRLQMVPREQHTSICTRSAKQLTTILPSCRPVMCVAAFGPALHPTSLDCYGLVRIPVVLSGTAKGSETMVSASTLSAMGVLLHLPSARRWAALRRHCAGGSGLQRPGITSCMAPDTVERTCLKRPSTTGLRFCRRRCFTIYGSLAGLRDDVQPADGLGLV